MRREAASKDAPVRAEPAQPFWIILRDARLRLALRMRRSSRRDNRRAWELRHFCGSRLVGRFVSGADEGKNSESETNCFAKRN
jgi:hypothetical protein